MKCTKYYKDEKKKQEYIKRNKDRYYNYSRDMASNCRCGWDQHDIIRVLKHNIPDRELAKELGRSVAAIQVIRHKYKDRGLI